MKNQNHAHVRGTPRRAKNPLVQEMLEHAENPDVRSLAEAFNTGDIHCRRAMLQLAATFAGTVSPDVVRELGKVKPDVTVRSGLAVLAVRRAMPGRADIGPSIEERLRRVFQGLALVTATIYGINEDIENRTEGAFTTDDFADAALAHIYVVYQELYWLRKLPGEVLNLPAPDDDHAERVEQEP